MKFGLICALVLCLAQSYTYAACGMTLSYGQSHLSGIPTEKINRKLTTKYTRVETDVVPSGTVTELGLECALSKQSSVALSVMTGVSAAVYRDVHFTGATYKEWELPPTKLFELDQRATARLERISYLYHFGDSFIAPLVRLGIERVTAKHTASVSAFGYSLARSEEKKLTAPYLGIGLTFGRDRRFSYRIEYQIESLPPHKLTTLTAGVLYTF